MLLSVINCDDKKRLRSQKANPSGRNSYFGVVSDLSGLTFFIPRRTSSVILFADESVVYNSVIAPAMATILPGCANYLLRLVLVPVVVVIIVYRDQSLVAVVIYWVPISSAANLVG